jgi:hypothetical protein
VGHRGADRRMTFYDAVKPRSTERGHDLVPVPEQNRVVSLYR